MDVKAKIVSGLDAMARTASGRHVLRLTNRAGLLPWRVPGAIRIAGRFKVDVGTGFIYHTVPADWIGRNLFWSGLNRWERETFPEFIRLAQSARTFLDIGANTGVYTLVATAVNPQLRAWAFEPVPQMVKRLEEHVRLNGLESRVTIVPRPVSDTPGPLRFHVASSEDQSRIVQDDGETASVMMIATTVDAEVYEPVDLVKMDVEGAEPQALRGMSRILMQDRPHIIIELLSDESAERVLALLPDHYTLWHLSFHGRKPFTGVVPGAKDRNYLCEPGSA